MNVVKRFPVTLAAVVLLWALRIGFLFSTARLRDTLGFGFGSSWWTWLTSALTVGTWVGALLSTVALLTLGLAAERRLGSRRFFAVAAISHIVGIGLGAVLVWALNAAGMYWGEALAQERVLNPFVWLCGVSMYASAWMGTLWRQRLRVIIFTLTISLLLYAGVMSDFAFFCAAIVGWIVGQWRSGRKFGIPRSSIREARVLVALAVLAVFTGPLISGLNPDAAGPFSGVAFFTLPQMTSEQAELLCLDDSNDMQCMHAMWQLRSSGFGPLLANLMPLALVAALSSGLVRGRRIAYRFTLLSIIATTAMLIFELVQYDLYNVPFMLYITLPFWILFVVLLATRKLFQVRLSPARRRLFYRTLGLWWLITALVWVVGAQWAFNAGLRDVLLATPLRYLPPQTAKFFTFDVLPFNTFAWLLTEWTGIVFWIGFIALFLRLLGTPPDPALVAEREQARSQLLSGTGDHLSWMTLWPGNNYWFGDGGYVAYRLHNGIAVTVGEPVVSGGSLVELADAFEKYIYASGAQVAWYSVRESFLATRADWHSILVAEESVVPVAEEPAFKGKKFQDIRTARNRAGKEGIHCEWTTWADCSLPTRAQITAISEEWVADKALPEMGFTLGGLPELDDPDVKLMVALSDDGIVHGVTSWLPAGDGIVLDFMRRRPDGFRPVVEFLIAETLLQAHNDGLKWVSLSGAPLAVPGVGPLGNVLDRVGHALEPLYGFRSLAAFKRKFDPAHESWLLLYRDELSLPAIGRAVSKCYLPETSMADLFGAFRK